MLMYTVLVEESLSRHPFKHWVNNAWQSLSSASFEFITIQ